MKTLLLLLLLLQTCFLQTNPVPNTETTDEKPATLSDSLLCQRFAPPPGYERVVADSGSFAFYLRHLPLKPSGAKVLLHDGREKPNPGIYEAVVNLPIGKKDLHQCADAVIRLRAEYLWQSGQYDKIHFNLTNGFRVDYERWRKGGRVKVVVNQTSWEQKAMVSDSYATFWQYLEFVFTYAGTLSLSKELEQVMSGDTTPGRAAPEVAIGDVFIQGGSPGHAVIVVDLTTDKAGKKAFLLAQSYMPAQEIQILKNPNDEKSSPWFSADFGESLETPEWIFGKGDLKRFRDE